VHCKWERICALPGCLLVAFFGLTTASGLAATNEELAELGEDALNAGKFEKAVAYFEKLVDQGETFEGIFGVRFDLAWSYYMVGRYEDAAPLFEGLTGNRAPSEAIRQQSRFMMAEVSTRLAEALPEGDPEREKLISRAITLHTKFQEDNKHQENIPESLYGRAAAFFLKKDLDAAARDLDVVINIHQLSPIAEEAKFLLASVYAMRGVERTRAGDKERARQYLDEARSLFDSVIAQGGSQALAASGMFSAAETWFEAGAYREAINLYREIPSREYLLKSLKSRLARLREERHAQMAQGSDSRVTNLHLGRYQGEYRRVDESPGWAIAAYFKIAEAYVALERQEEARTVARHLVNFTKGEQRQQAWYLIVSSYLDQAKGDDALREFTAIQEEFGNDLPIAQMAGIGIGQVFLLEGRFDEALTQFQKNLEEYPNGDGVEEATRWKVTALYYLDRYEESLAAAEAALAAFPDSKFHPNFLYFKSLSEAGLEAFEDGLATIDQVIQRYPEGTPEFDTPDDAFFQKAWMLTQMERDRDAVASFREFIDRFADSPLLPQAKYYLAVAMDAAGDQEGAFEVLRKLAADDPEHELAPVALYQIAISHYENEAFEEMGAALRDVVESFPSSPISAEALFWQGWLQRQDEKFEEAMASYRKSIELLPDGELAPEAMLSIALAGEEKAGAMGLPTVLPEEKREIYRTSMLNAVTAYEELLAAYPESDQVRDMPEGVADIYSQLVRSRQMTAADVEEQYAQARARHEGDPRGTAFLDASIGSFLTDLDGRREDALGAFRRALEEGEGVPLPPSLLSRYAEALKEDSQLSEAEAVYAKILADNPEDERVCAPALFGLGDIKYLQDDFEGAKEMFARVLEQYPWYEEGKKGRVLLARILERNGQFAEAEEMFTSVWQEERGEARIGAMLGVSRCQLALAERAKQSQDSGEWSDNIKVADQNLTRIIVLYEAFPEYVAEALWFKGRAHELNGDPDAARTNAYEILLRDYPDSDWAKKAQEVQGTSAPGSADF